jgi:lipopolysaccharide export system permease protein
MPATLRLRILDRYIVSEIGGPFCFGLSAFTLIFAATNILAVSRLVSEQHAPLGAALVYFLWQLPAIVVLVVPMAMLLGTLLALGRLSGESEITALKAGGVGLVRTVTPILVLGFIVSLLAYGLQEGIVPVANDRAVALREDTIQHIGPFGSGGQHTVITPLPAGGKQITYFGQYLPATAQLISVTIISYGNDNRPRVVLYSDRGRYRAPSWTFENARVYEFDRDGSVGREQTAPFEVVDIGEKPSELQERAADNNRESMSRSQIKSIISSGQLSPQETRAYQTTYEEKLARPFASFVFTLIAIPFGLRPARGGGGTGIGFSLSIGILFVYFIIASIFSAISTSLPGGYTVSAIAAWIPNVVFIAIGFAALRRAARY